jgi:hypothetical protein
MKKFKCKTIILIQLLSFSLFAQTLSGPVSPCVDCELLLARTEPYNGTWYNPDRSGSGFSFDVQNGTLFGTYYGYDEQGTAIWLTFVGDLVASEEPNVMWTLDADLLQFQEGNAFNQTYMLPSTTDYQGQIHIKFTQENHALFSVNGGIEQNIVPIIFGVAATADFPEQTSYLFPELTGLWVFVNYFNVENVPEPATTLSETLVITSKSYRDFDNDGLEDISYNVIKLGATEGSVVGFIVCQISKQNNQNIGPSCKFIDNRFSTDPFNPPTYNFSIGGLGAFRMFGSLGDGNTFEAIKLNSKDYLNTSVKLSLKSK